MPFVDVDNYVDYVYDLLLSFLPFAHKCHTHHTHTHTPHIHTPHIHTPYTLHAHTPHAHTHTTRTNMWLYDWVSIHCTTKVVTTLVCTATIVAFFCVVLLLRTIVHCLTMCNVMSETGAHYETFVAVIKFSNWFINCCGG